MLYISNNVKKIVIEEVIGWDLKNNASRKDIVGLFGESVAFGGSIEEQTRQSLHMHAQVWVKNFDLWRQQLNHEDIDIQKQAVERVVKAIDKVASCSLIGKMMTARIPASIPRNMFDHECVIAKSHRTFPKTVSDDQLRILRHREGCKVIENKFAHCSHEGCDKTWTNTALVESYIKKGLAVENFVTYPDFDVRRLKAMCVQYQKQDGLTSFDTNIVNASYNHHIHTSSCFSKKI